MVCAIALVMVVAIFSGKLPSGTYDIYTGSISAPKGASIWDSGLQIGDKLETINGCKINNVYTIVTIVKNSAKSNGIVSQKVIDENFAKLKGLNPALNKDEIIPQDLSIRLPEDLSVDVITMDKFAAKGAKYFKKEGIKLEPRIRELKKTIGDKTVYTSNGEYTLCLSVKSAVTKLHLCLVMAEITRFCLI